MPMSHGLFMIIDKARPYGTPGSRAHEIGWLVTGQNSTHKAKERPNRCVSKGGAEPSGGTASYCINHWLPRGQPGHPRVLVDITSDKALGAPCPTGCFLSAR